MKKSCIVSIGLLLLWFSMDMLGFSVGEIVLVEAAWNSIDGVWWLIFISVSFLFVLKDRIGKYLLTVFLFLWVLIQYFSHWHYTWFGASREKIISYNQYFEKTYHIIEPSSTKIIPDFYHIVLHLLILINLIFLLAFCISNRRNESEPA